jgi:hypothetical protein
VQTPGNVLKAQGAAALDAPGKLLEALTGIKVPSASKGLGIVPNKLGFDPMERPDLAVRYMLTGATSAPHAKAKTSAAKRYEEDPTKRGPGKPQFGEIGRSDVSVKTATPFAHVPKKVTTKYVVELGDSFRKLNGLAVRLSLLGKAPVVVKVLTTAKSASAALEALRAVEAGVPAKKVLHILHNGKSAKKEIGELKVEVAHLKGKHIPITSGAKVVKEELAEIARKLKGLKGQVWAGAPSPVTHWRGGTVKRYAEGGYVMGAFSPGEVIVHRNAAMVVPGPRDARDSVVMPVPVGAAVLTHDGQRRMGEGASLHEAVAMQMPHFKDGGHVKPKRNLTVAGKVSTFGPPGEKAGRTASGVSSSAPGVAIRPGATYQSGQPYLRRFWQITIAGHTATLQQTDIGPHQKTGRRIDVTGAGAKQMRLDPSHFPTGSVGMAQLLSGRGAGGVQPVPAGKEGKVPILVGREKRQGLVPDAVQKGIELVQGGSSARQAARAVAGARGAVLPDLTTAITESVGELTQTVKAPGVTKGQGKAGKAGGPSSAALGQKEGKGAFAGVYSGVAKIARDVMHRFGLHVTSTTSGNHVKGSYHYQGRAVDLADGKPAMDRAANYLNANYGHALTEGIHNPNLAVKNGRNVGAAGYKDVWAGHANHIHIALRRGGIVGFQRGGHVKRAVAKAATANHSILAGAIAALARAWATLGTLGALPPHAKMPGIALVPEGKTKGPTTGPMAGYTQLGRGPIHIGHGIAYLLGVNPKDENVQGARGHRAMNLAKQTLIHEAAHTMQRLSGHKTWEIEGGAQAWADEFGPRVYGRGYKGDDGNYAGWVQKVRRKGFKWINRTQFGFRPGGFIGRSIQHFRPGGKVDPVITQARSTLAVDIGTPAYTKAVAQFMVSIEKFSVAHLNRLVAAFGRLASKRGPASLIKAMQNAIDAAEHAIGEHIGHLRENAERFTAVAGRQQTELDRSLRERAIDTGSVMGLGEQANLDREQMGLRVGAVRAQEQALAAAKTTHKPELIKEETEKLATAREEWHEAVTKEIEDVRNFYRAQAQEGVELAQGSVSLAQGALGTVEAHQRILHTQDTAGGERERAATISANIVPTLEAAKRAAEMNFATLRDTQGSSLELQQATIAVQSAGNEIASAMADAAELVRKAAEDAAHELTEAAEHETREASTGLQKVELEQRLKGTFDTGGQARADYITTTLIPKLEAERAAEEHEKAVATEQGDAVLARQIAEAIAGKENDVRQAELDALEAIKSNTDPSRKVGGTLGFQAFGGGETLTDQLLGVS